MLPSGVFVRIAIDDLVAGLPDRLIYHGPSRLIVKPAADAQAPEEETSLEIRQWSDEWCVIEITGPGELNTLVIESLTDREPMDEVLSCYYHPESSDFSYAFYRGGQLMESFESRGSAVDTVSFTSELRRVPLQHLLKSYEFMDDAMRFMGIDPDVKTVPPRDSVVYIVGFPGKRTFWQALLGAVSPK